MMANMLVGGVNREIIELLYTEGGRLYAVLLKRDDGMAGFWELKAIEHGEA